MPFDVFALRDRVVGEYREYFESFVHIFDRRVEAFVRDKLAEGELWPDAVLQLNPAYAPAATLGDLAGDGTLTSETARYFGASLRLHRHQHEAIEIARRGEPYIVSTGTGSGKSLTYLVPIFDQVLRADPGRHSVRAIIVYPMNALINSQHDALKGVSREELAGLPRPLRQLHGAGQAGGAAGDPRRPAAHSAHQLRHARIHADPAGRAIAGRRGSSPSW